MSRTDPMSAPTPPAGSPASRASLRRTTIAAAALTLGSLTAVSTPAQAATEHGTGHGHGHGPHDRVPSQVALPDGFQPEGIATDRRGQAYLGSRADGDIYRVDLRNGKGKVIAQGPGTPSLGLKIDQRDRLFVAGGTGGDARVLDGRSGKTLASYRLVDTDAFINDVLLTRRAAYLTDSASAQLFVLPLGRHGELPRQRDVRRIELGGEWEQGADTSANGITNTPDGSALLVVNSSNGTLYRVDPRSGTATEVDLGGYAVTNGDGLLREGSTLYVVQNQLNKIAVIDLNAAGTRGSLKKTLTSKAFDVPTTVARFGDGLYLPNARFSTPATPDTTYTVNRVRVPEPRVGKGKGHGPCHGKASGKPHPR